MYVETTKQPIEFKLSEDFLSKYKDLNPFGDNILGYIVFKRTYARFIDNENRTEEFWETIKRVVEGCFAIQKEHCITLGLPWSDEKGLKSAEIMYDLMFNFKFLPAGRGLWMMGTEFIKKNGSMALNNCGFVSTESIDILFEEPFIFCMDSLMLGVGIGFDVKGAGKLLIKQPKFTNNTYDIPDSRAGWIKAVGIVLKGFLKGEEIPKFNYSLIRPAGTRIKSFGGISSGSQPLQELIDSLIDYYSDKVFNMITSVDIVDTMNMLGRCVVAGNVRRSAEIAIGFCNDEKFINIKKDKEKTDKYRWASNNSIFAEIGMDYSPIIENIINNGEPAIVYLDNMKKYSRMIDKPDYRDINASGCNPCGEQTLESYELCCLVETFPSHHDSYSDYERTLKYAYLYAKTVTLLNTHYSKTNAVMLKNRRIGVSQSGIIDAFVKHGRRNMLIWCDKGYNYLRKLDIIYSDWLCIPRSIKITTVKPSGTTSLLAKVSHGIHYPFANYYIRRVRMASDSDLLKILQESNYYMEPDKHSPNTIVVSFPIRQENFDRCQKDITIWEQFANASDYQKYWSDNQVSITINFKKNEQNEIIKCLEVYEDKLKCVSLLPYDNNFYDQMPMEEISKEEYKSMTNIIRPIELKQEIKEKSSGVIFCDNSTCKL